MQTALIIGVIIVGLLELALIFRRRALNAEYDAEIARKDIELNKRQEKIDELCLKLGNAKEDRRLFKKMAYHIASKLNEDELRNAMSEALEDVGESADFWRDFENSEHYKYVPEEAKAK
jgi:hypothetical protein